MWRCIPALLITIVDIVSCDVFALVESFQCISGWQLIAGIDLANNNGNRSAWSHERASPDQMWAYQSA